MIIKERRSGRRYLVIVRVGDHSLHSGWLGTGEARDYDVCLSYYGSKPGRYRKECEYYVESKGPKWPLLKQAVKELGERVFEYDAVWFPDDDILTDTATINRMFALFMEHQLLLAQPALTHNAFFEVTAKHLGYKLRYTHFVEAMVPIFSREALRSCWHTFDKNTTGWGLEHVWVKLLGDPHQKIAVLDEAAVKHTRPAGEGDLYRNIKSLYGKEVSSETENQVLKEYGIEPPEPHEITFYDGIRTWDPLAVIERMRQEEKQAGKRLPRRRRLRRRGLRRKGLVRRLRRAPVRRNGLRRVKRRHSQAASGRPLVRVRRRRTAVALKLKRRKAA